MINYSEIVLNFLSYFTSVIFGGFLNYAVNEVKSQVKLYIMHYII